MGLFISTFLHYKIFLLFCLAIILSSDMRGEGQGEGQGEVKHKTGTFFFHCKSIGTIPIFRQTKHRHLRKINQTQKEKINN